MFSVPQILLIINITYHHPPMLLNVLLVSRQKELCRPGLSKLGPASQIQPMS